MKEIRYRIIIGLALLGLIIGSYGIIKRLLFGLNPVAFGSYVPWGLWVAFYLFFLGLSAGAFLVTTMTYVFKMERFEKIGPLSAFTVLIALVCEVIFITLDLGQMVRIYRFLLTPSFTSLMTWMFVLFNAMLVIYALKTFFLIREELILWGSDPNRKGYKIYRLLSLGRTHYGTLRQETRRESGSRPVPDQPAGGPDFLRRQRGLFRHPVEPSHLEQRLDPPAVYHRGPALRRRPDHLPDPHLPAE